MDKRKNNKKRIIITLSVAGAAFALFLGVIIYLSDFYRADELSIDAFLPMERAEYSYLDDGSIVFQPQGATCGLIFYPGGKVEHEAYKPLMAHLYEKGILCVIAKMPFNLAVFDMNAADGIRAQFPQIDSWYIGGHSLGGSMASSYLEKHADEFDGLILLGSYSTADLRNTSLDVLSVYGSEDRVLNLEKYEECKSNLPDFKELVIDGGCHAYFGVYGEQDGDGEARISCQEQIRITAEAILTMVEKQP